MTDPGRKQGNSDERGWFRVLADSTLFAVFVYRGNRLFFANRAATELTGLSHDELLRVGLSDLVHDQSPVGLPPLTNRRDIYPPTPEPLEIRIRHVGGKERWAWLSLGILDLEGHRIGLASAIDVTERILAQHSLTENLELEHLLAEVSRRFLEAPGEEFDGSVGILLDRLGATTSADRVSMVLFDEARTGTSCAGSWCRPGAMLRELPAPLLPQDLPWIAAQLFAGEPVLATDSHRLPPEAAAERSLLDAIGAGAGLAVPFTSGGLRSGALVLECVLPRPDWGDAEVRLVGIAGRIVGAALHRVRAERALRTSRARLELALRAGRGAAWEWDLVTDRMRFSESGPNVLGLGEIDVPTTGEQLLRMIPPDDRQRIADTFRRIFSTGEPYDIEHRLMRPDGSTLWLSVRGLAERDSPDGRVVRVAGVSADITAARLAQEALRREKERAQVTLASIADGVIRVDAQGRIDLINPAAERLTGVSSAHAMGRPLDEIYRVIDEDSGRPLPSLPDRELASGARPDTRQPALLVRNDGDVFSVRDSSAPLVDEEGRPTGAVVVFQDVTRLRSLEREMSYLAAHDPLTGLINRREFESRLAAAIDTASATGRRFALGYLDLDDFKLVNDTCGHGAGDEMLRHLASVLETARVPGDTLARLGGDEFGLLLTNCDVLRAVERVERVLDAVRGYRFLWEDRVFEVRASVGIVAIPGHPGGLRELLSAADAACYVAKDRGRNQIHLSEPDDAEVAARTSEMYWVQRIQNAFEQGRFLLHFQRIEPLHPDAGPPLVEILLRLLDTSGQIVGPAQFLTAAERYRLMPAIDRWVVTEAMPRIARLAQSAPEICFAINLSGQSMADLGLRDLILELVERHGVEGPRLLFEVTETAAISSLQTASAFIDSIHRIGCRFVLDDFGSGLSSFRYLRHLKVSFLKIDGELVRDIATDPTQREMVAAIQRIGESMGIGTIGEWVESNEIARTLAELGVAYGQGYGFHRPEPFDPDSEQCRSAACRPRWIDDRLRLRAVRTTDSPSSAFAQETRAEDLPSR